MPIPRKPVQIELQKDTPSPLTVEALQKQLNNIGLDCAHTDPKRLEQYKNEVEKSFPDGKNQSFGIQRPKAATDGTPYYKSVYSAQGAPFLGFDEASRGDWSPEASALGYATQLSTIIFSRNFNFLVENKQGFGGMKSDEKITQRKFETVEAIKELFTTVGVEASASLVKGLDKTTLNSIFSNAIAPLNEGNVKDYDVTDSRVIFLVENYDPIKKEADAIGVLGVDWHLKITDYKEKKKNPLHDTTLKVTTRSVLYDSLTALDSDLQFIKSHFGPNVFDAIPPRNKEIKIYDSLPPANQDTFDHGLPLIAKDGYVDVIIMYAPDLQSVGSIDNSDSDGQANYSKSITSGFTFSMSQKISTSASFAAGVVFAKGKFTIGLEFSFTEQWNNSQTETIAFTVPARKKAFTYQGYVLSRKLRFFPEDGSFKYVESEGRFLTNILKTSDTPIVGTVTTAVAASNGETAAPKKEKMLATNGV